MRNLRILYLKLMQRNQCIIFIKNIYLLIFAYQLFNIRNLSNIFQPIVWNKQRFITPNLHQDIEHSFKIFQYYKLNIYQQYTSNHQQQLKEFQQQLQMTSQEQLNQIKQKYLDSLNRVNLLLLKQHDLRRDQKLYQQELEKVQSLISKIEKGRQNGMNIIAEDSYLRQMIKQNDKQIKKLQRKLNSQQIYNQFKELKAIQQKYIHMISNDFQNGIQQKLSTIRGKVDELKKKIKEINKEILSYQQEHLEGIDEYSFSLNILKNYQQQIKQLKESISRLRQSQRK